MEKKQKIIVLGYDGYIGTAVTQRLLSKGHTVVGVDDHSKRVHVTGLGSKSAIDQLTPMEKTKEFMSLGRFTAINMDIAIEADELDDLISAVKPDTIVNLAHNPSAPFSMISHEKAQYVLVNNIISTNNLLWSIKKNVPDCHLISIGTTGEYDHTSNIDIEEGYITLEHNGRTSNEMIYPRRPGSIYHTSKVANTYLIDYTTRAWGLRTTDIMQSVVFGNYTEESAKTGILSPLHSDEAFGTVINRFIVQAKLGVPLTVYGEGKHRRGFLALNDSVQALEIAVNNPPEPGRTRVWNQLSEWHSMNDLAEMVKETVESIDEGKTVEISHIPTPRNEHTGEHYYNYKTDILKSLGYVPTRTIKEEIAYTYERLSEDIDQLKEVVTPKINFTDPR